MQQKLKNMRRPSKKEKRHREEDAAEEEEDSAPKRPRSVHQPMTPEDNEVYEEHIEELHEEVTKDKPNRKQVKRLMRATYTGRRRWVENDLPRVAVVLEKFPPLREPKHVSHYLRIAQNSMAQMQQSCKHLFPHKAVLML